MSPFAAMKLPPFDYVAPATVEETVALLAKAEGAAKVIAGGQSLLPVMAFRLASPGLLVDIRRLAGLAALSIDEDGVRLGARVRWCDIIGNRRLATAHPLLVAAIGHVAHYQVRNRGTVGGSLAHADPAAEMPGLAVVCDAELTLRGPMATRIVPAADFFLGPLSTALADDELIVEVKLPRWPAGRRWAFEEFSRRRGDFAIAGIAVHYDLDEAARARSVHIGVIGACSRPHRVPEAEAIVEGQRLDEATILAAAAAAAATVEPPEDMHASEAYRRGLVETLLERALRRAANA